MQTSEKILEQTAAPKVAQRRVMTNFARTPKSRIFCHFPKGDHTLKVQASEKILAQIAAPKGVAKASYDKFGKDTQTALLLRFSKEGTKGKSLKSGSNLGP